MLYGIVHLLVLTKFVNQFTIHGMNNKKVINTQQANTIQHYKNSKFPEDGNYAEIRGNKLIIKIHNIWNGATLLLIKSLIQFGLHGMNNTKKNR